MLGTQQRISTPLPYKTGGNKMDIGDKLKAYLKAADLMKGDVITLFEDMTTDLENICFLAVVTRKKTEVGTYKYSPNMTILRGLEAENNSTDTKDYVGSIIDVLAFMDYNTGKGFIGEVRQEENEG